jgi:hypothetical protein
MCATAIQFVRVECIAYAVYHAVQYQFIAHTSSISAACATVYVHLAIQRCVTH